MNIILICHVFPPEHAPAGVNYMELAADLARQGHRVTMITGWPSHPGGKLYPGWKASFSRMEVMPEGYRLLRCLHSFRPRARLLAKMWYFLSFALSTFWSGLRAGPADVVFFSSSPIFGECTAWLLGKIKRAKLVYWIHDLHPESARNAGLLGDGLVYRAMLALDRFLCRRSDLVGVLTDAMKKGVENRGIPPDKVALLLHWVDAGKIQPASPDNPWRRRHGIAPDRFVVLHAGTIGYISGAEVIPQAARLLQDRGDILFLFVGEGPLKPRLEALAAEWKLTNTMFLPFQPAEVLCDVQAVGDVGLVTLLPQTGESSIPSKMHGYTAAARPVIASVAEDSPTAEMVRREGFGLVCRCQDPQALADAVRWAADHRGEAQAMGRRGREFFLRVFDRGIGVARIAETFARLVRGESGPPPARPG